MFIRFVVDQLDPQSGRRQGLFQAVHDLQDAGRLSPVDDGEVHGLLVWFTANLATPKRLAVTSRPHGKAQALSWFKDTANEHIDKMRRLIDVVERHGITVRMIRTERPGYVLYEDDHQIAAYPFADTPT